jgi:peptidyl-prolyl cis-trans isomerase C
MRPRGLLAVAALASLFAVLFTTQSSPRADMPPEEAARRAKIVAHVGPRTVTVGELEDRLAMVPRFQLATFGNSPDAIRRKFLNDIVVQDLLLSAGAQGKKLDKELPTSHQIQRALSSATLRAVRVQVGAASAIAMDDVKRFYDENKNRYDAPERFGIWRILCKTREEAVDVIAAAKKDPTPKNYEALARDHSLDKATYLRGGNLGFIAPDGTSNEAGLKVDPAIPKAAAAVKDGELVAQPVAEGEYFAVVWRRGTIAAAKRTVDDAAGQIRDTLWKQRVEAAQKKLEDELRARDVRDINPDLLRGIDISTSDGNIIPRKRPGQVTPLSPAAPGAATTSAQPK